MRNHYYFKTCITSFTIVVIKFLSDSSKLTCYGYKHYILKDSCINFYREYSKYKEDISNLIYDNFELNCILSEYRH